MDKEPNRNQRQALGRGLSALLPPRTGAAPAPAREVTWEPPLKPDLPEKFEQFQSIRLEELVPNAEQPRESFDAEKLEELAQSIQANGLIQPITVRRRPDGKYTIIAGERRWRAARLAGLKAIPALVRAVEDDKLLELALVENLQREDLNPVEIATGFQRLAHEHGMSHEEIAQRTGKDRSTVTNFLRLLKLTPLVLNELTRGTITMGHARALLNITDEEAQARACHHIIDRGLSVRETEELVNNLTTATESPQTKERKEGILDPNVRAALEDMARVLGTRVRLVQKSESRGRLEIEYYSPDDLDRIYSIIVKQ